MRPMPETTSDPRATVETVIADPRWAAFGLPALAETAAGMALAEAGLAGDAWEIGLLGCDDAEMARLNGDFRDRPQPTNVLSWPSAELGPDGPGGVPLAPDAADGFLGDIALAWETTMREAEAGGIPPRDHALHLMVHAVLHLLGYDHDTEEDAQRMEALEVSALARLGIANPY